MNISLPDTLSNTDRLESVEVELTPKQVEWLRKKADERDLSVDHVLRSIITAQIRAQGSELDEPPAPTPSGDGQSSSKISSSATASDGDDPPSIVDSLRSASEQLQDLTEQDDAAEAPDPHDPLERLQARLGTASDAEDESSQTVVLDTQTRSMFDLMEENE